MQDYIGRTEAVHDTIWQPSVAAMAATLGIETPQSTLPPLWHWMLFQRWAPATALGVDGHPQRGSFLPPLPGLDRRMWAGGRVVLLQPLPIGAAVTRTTTILAITEKPGASGPLVFVTLRHTIAGPDGPAIEEEQDLVFRATQGEAVKPGGPAPTIVPIASHTVTPDAVLLFRYSALTGNSHRIHYDADYARTEEGYPGLVVHGPLQATWLASLAQVALGGMLSRFSYRGRRPAFVGRMLTLEASNTPDGMRLRTVDADGAVSMTAEAA